MLSLVLTVIALLAFIGYTARRLQKESRSVYLGSIVVAMVLGTAASLVYTWDNEVLHGQPDMPGDAQYYYNAAVTYLNSGSATALYPLYYRLLANFLRDGGALIARLGQTAMWLMAYSATVLVLNSQGLSRRGLKTFAVLMVGSGLYYGLATQLVRDTLILVGMAFLHAIVVATEGALTQRKGLGQTVLLMGLGVLASVVLSIALGKLQPWLDFLLVLAVLMEYAAWGICRYRDRPRIVLGRGLVLITLVVVALVALQQVLAEGLRTRQEMVSFWMRNVVVEGSLLSTAPRDVFSPFATLLGPGLIRPLFPSEYFLVWIPSHVAFYWWGTATWYLTLLVGVPLIAERPLRFWGKRGTMLLATLFVGYTSAYVLAYGSGIGLRKRAILAYLFTSYVASTYWTSEGVTWGLASLKTRIPRRLVFLILLLLLGLAQLLSVTRNIPG